MRISLGDQDLSVELVTRRCHRCTLYAQFNSTQVKFLFIHVCMLFNQCVFQAVLHLHLVYFAFGFKSQLFLLFLCKIQVYILPWKSHRYLDLNFQQSVRSHFLPRKEECDGGIIMIIKESLVVSYQVNGMRCPRLQPHALKICRQTIEIGVCQQGPLTSINRFVCTVL